MRRESESSVRVDESSVRRERDSARVDETRDWALGSAGARESAEDEVAVANAWAARERVRAVELRMRELDDMVRRMASMRPARSR